MPKVVKVGVVKSNKMDKTAVVSVERLVRHPLYTRAFKKTSNFTVHDEANKCQVGDRVKIVECRPISKRKRWKLVEILVSPAEREAKVQVVEDVK
ncbi:MAG: 30S ribosomal protein S17 [Acidobacteria bacterium]|nr:MAG: 30S ribosomal protein S17 [Acidobacteriota bacterium]